MTQVEVLSVLRVDDDTTQCRRCHRTIPRGRRAADVAGTGSTCLRCLIDQTLDPPTEENITMNDDADQADDDGADEPAVITIGGPVGSPPPRWPAGRPSGPRP